jgi:hypothetical protein
LTGLADIALFAARYRIPVYCAVTPAFVQTAAAELLPNSYQERVFPADHRADKLIPARRRRTR